MQTRTTIGPETIKAAAASAAEAVSTAEINDWNDTSQTFLTLRQRGKKVSWLVRAFGKSARLGSAIGQHRDPEYLGLREAREAARLKYHEIAAAHGADPAPPAAWTWADLDREFQASLKEPRLAANKKIKPPSPGTQDDVKRMFAKAPVVGMGPILLTALTAEHVETAVDAVHAAHGHRTAAKTMAYVKSALTWALSKRGGKSGLRGVMPWWSAMRPPDPTGEQLVAMTARKKALTAAKVGFSVDHLGELLTRHEAFCAGRLREERVGPGVRYGLWFLCFTGGRRGSTTGFEREGLLQSDPFGREGWGRAAWTEESMKGKSEFWLPLPPPVLSIANNCIADWKRLVENHHGVDYEKPTTSRWVFASTQRQSDDEARDLATYPNSLNAHLRALRGTKKGRNFGEDVLAGLPWFTLHLVRSIAGNFLDGAAGVPKAAISAMLAHADGDEDDKLAPTTKAFYVQSQRMELKAIAMDAWSEALIRAVEKAGGTLPEPNAKLRLGKAKILTI
jgi:hypothetical protein